MKAAAIRPFTCRSPVARSLIGLQATQSGSHSPPRTWMPMQWVMKASMRAWYSWTLIWPLVSRARARRTSGV